LCVSAFEVNVENHPCDLIRQPLTLT